MKINKLIRQYGEQGNDYSVLEIGDTVNEIIDYLNLNLKSTFILDKSEKEDEFYSKGEAEVEFESLKQVEDQTNYTLIKGDIAVRSQSSQDRVYLIREGRKHWIKNPETLFKLGFTFHNVKNITNEEMDKYETDEDIDLSDNKPLKVVEPTQDGFDKYNL